MKPVKGNFALKDIAKQLMDMRPGELVLLNGKKTIVESEMRHLRKIEGVLIQLRYVYNVAEHMLLVLMNNYAVRYKMLHALSVYPIKKTLGVRCMFPVCPGI